MLEPTRRLPSPTWAVVLDGDEILLWGELVRDVIAWATEADSGGNVNVALPLRLVESDGSVALLASRVLRIDLVKRWVASSNQIEFRNGTIGAFPNQRLVSCGDPDSVDVAFGLQARRPVQGEPHVLHRSGLRDPGRVAERQHRAEATDWEHLVQRAGMEDVDLSRKEEGVRLWLPK
jgi:hypothetical protein